MSAHPCPSCGSTLRWVPEQTSWACDRCGTLLPAQQAAPPQQAAQSGLAQAGWQPVATNLGMAPAGGSFGGSAASSSPIAARLRSPSQPPGVHTAPASQAPPQAQPANPYGNAGFGGSATSATPPQSPSQFGIAPYPAPQPGGFGGSATGAQPQRSQSPSQPPFAADPHAPSTPGYGPGGYPSYTPPPVSADDLPVAAKKPKRGLMIAIGAVVAIAAGVTIAVVLSKSGGKTGGLGSPDELATETVAALTAGDVDRLVALMSPELSSEFITCDEEAQKKREPEKALSELRETLVKTVAMSKGLSIELVKLGAARTTKLDKGKDAGKGCTFSTDLAMHNHDLVVKVKSGDRAAQERTFKINFVEADGRWFLSTAPQIERPGDCAAATKAMLASNKAALDKVQLGEAARARLEKAALQHCTEDAWTDAVKVCFEDASRNKTCAKQLTESQQEKLDKQLTAIINEDIKSREVPAVGETPTTTVDPTIDPTKPPGSAPGAGSGSGTGSGSATVPEVSDQLPPICDDYKAQIDKLASCRRMKNTMKKAQREAYQMIVEGWQRITKKTEAQRTSFEEICKKSLEGLVDLRKTLCR